MVVAIGSSTTVETTIDICLWKPRLAHCLYRFSQCVVIWVVTWYFMTLFDGALSTKNGDDIFFLLLWIADGSFSPELTYHYDRELGTWSNYNHISNLFSRIHVSHQPCGPVPYHSAVGGPEDPLPGSIVLTVELNDI